MSIWNQDWLGVALATGGTVVMFIVYSLWSRSRGHEAIRRWAGEQGFTIVHCARRSFVPHWGATSGKGYQFFRLDVRDKQGFVLRAWARCSDLGRTDPGSVEVIWDEN